ncbi:MAG: peptide chain release factor N(5)-glutamine methyltransferase [Streptomycetales bacterium]
MNHLIREIGRATVRLADAGVPAPRSDAEELAAFVHGVGRGMLHTVADAEFDAKFWEAVARRVAREPLQHITGRAPFRHLEVAVGPGVFVPRPETEAVAGWAITLLRARTVDTSLVVDLGTGSGAMALAIATEVPGTRVYAVERDPGACVWARRNLAAAGRRDGRGDAWSIPGDGGVSTVELSEADLADALRDLDGGVDVVVCNPPYIPLGEVLDVEAGEHDPAEAVWAGRDGLEVIRAVERAAARLLKPGGFVVVEHHEEQGHAVPELFHVRGGWVEIAGHRDLADRDRFVTARREGVRP